ncbi:surface protease GP63 [Trypanosoma grayi]|uniref:surface protease GP63 n=1 Tax=Trypanosoma grayi TaxID=71804 RepID=UPI0004F485A1|nr:surface protease GP63 [Trypanosoma grayi]KEG10867.1 surface protease GP63 [Trypanosoma grayi]
MKKRHLHRGVTVVREVPRRGQGARHAYTASPSGAWAPLRILVSTLDLEDERRYCTALGQHRPSFIGGNAVCYGVHVLTPEKKRVLDRTIPVAVKLHTDRLLVLPVVELLKVPALSAENPCFHFTVPSTHHSPGVEGYDTVLYAAAGPSLGGTTVAWTSVCAHLPGGRPALGAMYFAPEKIDDGPVLARVAAHEMAHALGFEIDFLKGRNMVTVLPLVRGKRKVSVVSSRKVSEWAKVHYNCTRAIGMELEDNGGDGTELSHWKRRNARDELMSPIVSTGYYTALTMAVFEDTGHYRANWGMEEPMSWGRDAGCEFLEEKCVKDGHTKYPDMFCTAGSPKFVCTSDRMALGTCGLYRFSQDVAWEYQYFADRRLAGGRGGFMDYCPIIVPNEVSLCSGKTKSTVRGSRTGPSSWCLKGVSLREGVKTVGDVCAEVVCDNGIVKVRYAGNTQLHVCKEGSMLQATGTFTGGYIVCPKYAEVCTIAPNGSSLITIPPAATEEERVDLDETKPKDSVGIRGDGGQEGIDEAAVDAESSAAVDTVSEEPKKSSDAGNNETVGSNSDSSGAVTAMEESSTDDESTEGKSGINSSDAQKPDEPIDSGAPQPNEGSEAAAGTDAIDPVKPYGDLTTKDQAKSPHKDDVADTMRRRDFLERRREAFQGVELHALNVEMEGINDESIITDFVVPFLLLFLTTAAIVAL